MYIINRQPADRITELFCYINVNKTLKLQFIEYKNVIYLEKFSSNF